MKYPSCFFHAALLLIANMAFGQGTFVYDQQSSLNQILNFGAGTVQQSGPGQSFTPSLSSVEFIQLLTSDANPGNGPGAELYLILRANSITGTIIGTSSPVEFTYGFSGLSTFLFSTPVSVTPGTTYYFLPVVSVFTEGGAYGSDAWRLGQNDLNYPGGTMFVGGIASPGFDFWFREGIIVPEPSTALIGFMGLGLLVWLRDKQRVRE
jgi:hypothetical protein